MSIQQALKKEIEESKRWPEVAKEADVMVSIKKATYK